MGQELRLDTFKQLYLKVKSEVVWLDHLILGLLVWLEARYLDIHVEMTVDEALKELELPPMEDYVTPVIIERPSEGSTSLPEVRITAPWYKES